MKIAVILVLAFILGMYSAYLGHRFTPKVEQVPNVEQDISVELSVDGKVKVLKAPPASSVHIIVDENLMLTDLQVLPHASASETIPVNSFKQNHGQPTNTTTAEARP